MLVNTLAIINLWTINLKCLFVWLMYNLVGNSILIWLNVNVKFMFILNYYKTLAYTRINELIKYIIIKSLAGN